jgi:uncharacterized protein (TIGR02001 family)
MKKMVLSVLAASGLSMGSAFAADIPVKAMKPPPAPESPWDWAFGGALLSDYNFRGISQSNRGATGTVYSETRFNATPAFQFYFGQQAWGVTLPTRPTCECDFYAGIRPTIGPLAFDFGAIYYWYPKEKQVFLDPGTLGLGNSTIPGAIPFTTADTDFWEVYGKVTWEVLKDRFVLGANAYYSPNWLKTGADGTFASVTAKFMGSAFKFGLFGLDEVGWYISGEAGHYWLGQTSAFFGNIQLPDYNFFNAGLAFTWKVATLDIRFYGTDLSKAQCFLLTGDPGGLPGGGGLVGRSNWCSDTVVAALKFDLSAKDHLK